MVELLFQLGVGMLGGAAVEEWIYPRLPWTWVGGRDTKFDVVFHLILAAVMAAFGLFGGSGVALAFAIYAYRRWRDKDDDWKRRKQERRERQRARFRAFAPSPIPAPAGGQS